MCAAELVGFETVSADAKCQTPQRMPVHRYWHCFNVIFPNVRPITYYLLKINFSGIQLQAK